MLKAVDLLRQGKNEELWQMCCGYLKLDIQQFMDIQKRLLLEQLELLNNSPLGKKMMHRARPQTIEEFREQVPLTTYADYCPELEQQRDDFLPVKPDSWIRTSGRSGAYAYKWIPMTRQFSTELSIILYGIGMLSCCNSWGDTSQIPNHVKLLYSIAPRPYTSGFFADILRNQTPLHYLPDLETAEGLSFEERIRLGFHQGMSQGIDYFFGLSLVLSAIGDKFQQSSDKINLAQYLMQPRALWRLGRGLLKSRLAKRQILPKDIWSIKGIIGSGVDSIVYQDRIEKLWGRRPLDIYSSTEGGVISTQTWDYGSMTFIPNLNFLEFIPEEEHFKLQMDGSYQPKILLLDEVKAGENYELVISNFHGGAMVRYRIGDMVKITSLQNEKLGIKHPQIVFERRVDGLLDFMVVRLTEKTIWQALETTGIAYEDWIAYKKPGEPVLCVLIEPKNGLETNKEDITRALQAEILRANDGEQHITAVLDDLTDMIDFSVEVEILPNGTFAKYTAQKKAEGADLAHLKPPHINPPAEVLSLLSAETEEIIVVTKPKTEAETPTEGESEAEKVSR
jgi:hypothetical protein